MIALQAVDLIPTKGQISTLSVGGGFEHFFYLRKDFFIFFAISYDGLTLESSERCLEAPGRGFRGQFGVIGHPVLLRPATDAAGGH
jgi:hypothetical protein